MCRSLPPSHGMSEGTFLCLQRRSIPLLSRCRKAKAAEALEDGGTRKLKKLLAEQMLDMARDEELLSKKR